MKKTLLILLSALLFGATTATYAHSMEHEEAGAFSSTVEITVKGKLIQVSGAEGTTMNVYNLTGVSIASFPISSNHITLRPNLPKGCYILKIGKVVRKISIS